MTEGLSGSEIANASVEALYVAVEEQFRLSTAAEVGLKTVANGDLVRVSVGRFRAGNPLVRPWIPLKFLRFQLPWGVSAVGSAHPRASWVKLGPMIFRHPPAPGQFREPSQRRGFLVGHRDWGARLHRRLNWRQPGGAAHVLWWF